MIKKMTLEIFPCGGGVLERELSYSGKTEKEIAEKVQRDENDLLYYMRTGDDCGEKCFMFQGFMITKKKILAAQFSEPEY